MWATGTRGGGGIAARSGRDVNRIERSIHLLHQHSTAHIATFWTSFGARRRGERDETVEMTPTTAAAVTVRIVPGDDGDFGRSAPVCHHPFGPPCPAPPRPAVAGHMRDEGTGRGWMEPEGGVGRGGGDPRGASRVDDSRRRFRAPPAPPCRCRALLESSCAAPPVLCRMDSFCALASFDY